jgi:hypothetical protein
MRTHCYWDIYYNEIIKQITMHNTDSLINCLRQPGQLSNQLRKSIRENSSQLIKLCVP